MRYHVYIEGSRDRSPTGLARLASALAGRYGLAEPVVQERLAHGRFCAWASVDHDTARRLAAEVEGLGGVVLVREESAAAAARQTTPGLPAPPAGARPPAGPYASGLAAAYAGDKLAPDVQFDLGALHGGESDDASWQLARLDGTEEELTTESPAVIAAALAADRALATPAGAGASPQAIPGAPVAPGMRDPFAPPGAADPFAPPDVGREQELELEHKPAAAGTVAPVAPVAAGSGSMAPVPATSTFRGGAPASGSATLHRDSALTRLREAMAESPRARFAAAVAAAFLLGLVPAQIFAAVKKAGAYDGIRADLEAEYKAADTAETWSTLQAARADAEALVASRQRRLAVSTGLIWLLVGGAVGFVWLRVIPWEDQVPRLAPAGPPAGPPSGPPWPPRAAG